MKIGISALVAEVTRIDWLLIFRSRALFHIQSGLSFVTIKKIASGIFINKKDKDGKNVKAGLQAIIDKLVKKNIIHKNNGSRKKANFAKTMKGLS